VEQVPFGVTIHRVEEVVDSGSIVAQQSIPYDWTDNGETLYLKAKSTILELFKRTYPALRSGAFLEVVQPTNAGSFHKASELDDASIVDLDERYKARDLLNLLRARTFTGKPACRFTDAGETFEVRVTITRTK
jgi:methionyl-tRNA formyltransferase